MKNKFIITAAVIFSSHLYAQDSTKTTLDEVVVTANKVAQKQSSTGKVVTVITKDVIEKSAGKSVGQLLNEQAGITINGALNNMGSNQTIFMRGASSGRTLVLIDGIPVSDPSLINNEFDLNLISLTNVERIEICKGAQSTLYGSDAVAGVINIITIKSDIHKPVNANATVSAGSFNTIKAAVQLYGKVNNLTYTAAYSKIQSTGFSAAYDKTGKNNFDNDGYNSDALKVFLKYDLTKQLSVSSFIQNTRYKTGLDAGPFTDKRDYNTTNKGLITGANVQFKNEAVTVTAKYQYSEFTRYTFNDSTDSPGYLTRGNYKGKAQFADVFANIKLSKNFSLLQGADYHENKMGMDFFGTYPSSQYGPAGTYSSKVDSSISQSSLYASIIYSGLQGRLNIDLGGRLNVNSRYGNNNSYSFNPSYKINENLRVLGSISSAYKTPSLYQLYSEYGNVNLKVEQSKSYELGLDYKHNNFSNRLVYFYRDINNAIDFNNLSYQYFNIINQIVRGVEYEFKVQPIKGLSITGNYTYLSATEKSQSRENFADTSYNYVLRRPKNSFNLNAGYQFSKALYVSAGAKYVSKREDVGGYQTKDISLDAYTIFNAYAEYKFCNRFKIFVDGQNLTGKKFFDINGYNSIPFVFTAGITANF